MDEQTALVGLAGTLLGAVIAGVVAIAVNRSNNDHAVTLEASRRLHEDKVRKHAAGIRSAKEVLLQLNHIRWVFDRHEEPFDPEQEWYESPYRLAILSAVDIDDETAAKTLTDIAEVYWASWLATFEGDWTPQTLSNALYKLAHSTVRAYTQGKQLPDTAELQTMLRAIESNAKTVRENDALARAEYKKSKDEAAAKPKSGGAMTT